MLKLLLLILIGISPFTSNTQAKKEDKVITLFLIGNSTVADKPYKDGNPEKGWGQVFPLYFNEGVKVENHAVNGRSTRSFINEGRWEVVLNKLKKGDYVIIEFGHNDAKKEDPSRYAAAETDFKDNLRKFINETRSKGAVPILATPIVRRKFENGILVETHGRYPNSIREIAEENNVFLLDLHLKTKLMLEAFGEEKSKRLFLHVSPDEYKSIKKEIIDNTHLSAYGAFKVCDLVVEELRKSSNELSKFLKE